MTDFAEGQIVKTKRDNEFKTKLVDGQSGTVATKVLTVAEDGDTYAAGTNDFGVPLMIHTADGKLRFVQGDAAGNLKAVVGNPSTSSVVSDYKKHAAVASGVPDNHDKIITTAKTVTNLKIQASATGLFRFDIGIWDGTVFTPYASVVTTPSNPRATIDLIAMPIGDGTKAVRVIANNLDATADDAYSTTQFLEN